MLLGAATPQIYSLEEEENKFLKPLLGRTFKHVEKYCNAQTRLQNVLIEGDRVSLAASLQTLVIQLEDSITGVGGNLDELKKAKDDLSSARRREALSEHIDCCGRVVSTVFASGAMIHSNGIPTTADDIAMKTVALSVLKASTAQVERKLGV